MDTVVGLLPFVVIVLIGLWISIRFVPEDSAPINIDFLVYWKVVDPTASVLNVQDFAGASQGIATTTLRAVVGDIPLEDVLAKREQINTILRTRLDEITERWGVKVTSVEIREIQPPVDVQQAMNEQRAVERSRRAVVLEADGTREAAILRAEGFSLGLQTVEFTSLLRPFAGAGRPGDGGTGR